MKTILSPVLLLLASASSSGALAPASGGRLTDYTNWFAPEFNVASDANYIGNPYPRINAPDAFAMDGVHRDWSGWAPSWPPGLTGPFTGESNWARLRVEVVFLGETAGWWDDLGYRLNGVDYLLADGVQAKGGLTRAFGDYAEFSLGAGETLDFFVTGSGIRRQDGAITEGASGGRYYVFETSLSIPLPVTLQSYYGILTPLTSVRGPEFLGDEMGALPFTVMGFEDISLTSGRADRDYNDLLFAFRAGSIVPCCGPIPEPSAFGLLAAAALVGLVAWRQRRTP